MQYSAHHRSVILGSVDQTRPIICVLDDQPKFCRVLARLPETHGFYFVTFKHGKEFVAAWGVTVAQLRAAGSARADY